MRQQQRKGSRRVGAKGLFIAAALIGAASAGGCADHPSVRPSGLGMRGLPPTLIVRNESATTVRVFPWMGRLDGMSEAGASGFREKAVFDVPPGQTRRVGLGVPNWPTAAQDGIVRVGILDLGIGAGPYPTVEEYAHFTRWFEFEQPHPYDLRISGTGGKSAPEGETGALEFESLGQGALIELAGGAGEG